ncbi:MAG: response regulator transcription factor [Saprospiraceae bacterium]|nr:response regulator transcription factor [Saprospiraceae bacterium]
MIRCLAVDDEPLALDLLEDNISKIPYLTLVGKCYNAREADAFMSQEAVDLLFLDIQMPGLSGVQFLKSLKDQRPMAIFITAYEKFALEGYALDVLDYLVKPVAFDRFEKACHKAQRLFDLKNAQMQLLEVLSKTENTEGGLQKELSDFFFVNADYSHIKITIADILYIESMKDYLKIYLTSQAKPIITRMTMKTMEEKLADYPFLRVHKSFIVSLPRVEAFKSQYVIVQKQKLPVSESYRIELQNKLNAK